MTPQLAIAAACAHLAERNAPYSVDELDIEFMPATRFRPAPMFDWVGRLYTAGKVSDWPPRWVARADGRVVAVVELDGTPIERRSAA